jgi:hypothetical protein
MARALATAAADGCAATSRTDELLVAVPLVVADAATASI